MSAHTQDHYRAAIKALADERKDCKRGTMKTRTAAEPFASELIVSYNRAAKLAEALRATQAELGSLGNYLHNLQGPLPTGEAKAMAAELVRIFAPARAALAEWDAQS